MTSTEMILALLLVFLLGAMALDILYRRGKLVAPDPDLHGVGDLVRQALGQRSRTRQSDGRGTPVQAEPIRQPPPVQKPAQPPPGARGGSHPGRKQHQQDQPRRKPPSNGGGPGRKFP